MAQFFGGDFYGGTFFDASPSSGDFYGGQFFGGNFFEAVSPTTGDFFNGQFFGGNFFGEVTPQPEEPAFGGSGAGQPVSSYRPNPFRDAIREANKPQERRQEKKRKERKQPGPVTGLLAEIADSITPEMIAAEVDRLRILGEYIDELTARAELARQIMQDDEDAMVVLMLAV